MAFLVFEAISRYIQAKHLVNNHQLGKWVDLLRDIYENEACTDKEQNDSRGYRETFLRICDTQNVQ